MKTTYISCCIDTGVSQLNKVALLLSASVGLMFAILPPPIPGFLLLGAAAILLFKGAVLYRYYREQYDGLSGEDKETVSLYFSKHHHARTLFLLPMKCTILGVSIHAVSQILFV